MGLTIGGDCPNDFRYDYPRSLGTAPAQPHLCPHQVVSSVQAIFRLLLYLNTAAELCSAPTPTFYMIKGFLPCLPGCGGTFFASLVVINTSPAHPAYCSVSCAVHGHTPLTLMNPPLLDILERLAHPATPNKREPSAFAHHPSTLSIL